MAKPRNSDLDTDEGTRSASGTLCPDCDNRDPHIRATHHIDMARLDGLDGLRRHLHKQYVSLRDADTARPDVVDSICQWIANLIEQFSGMADPDTGRPWSWYEARAYMARQQHKIATDCYRRSSAQWQATSTPPSVELFVQAGVVAPRVLKHPQMTGRHPRFTETTSDDADQRREELREQVERLTERYPGEEPA